MTGHAVTIYVDVDDEVSLFAHASAKAREDGLDERSIEEMLGTSHDVDVSACLRYTFDPGTSPPGTSILDSVCESSSRDVNLEADAG